MRVLRPAITGSLLVTALVAGSATPVGADAVTDGAVDWIVSQQQPDGGFELAGFPGFETPDAVLAIAANAQTGDGWSTSEARAAVEAIEHPDTDATPLDWLDDFVEGGVPAGQRAKLVVLNALALGDDPTAYDPAGDGDPVDLTEGLDTIPPGLFNSFLFGRLAEPLLGDNVHQSDLQVTCEGQHAGGGWSFDGDPGGADPDLDTTGLATMALVAAGVAADDPVLGGAGQYLESTQEASGAWQSFDADDPNATAMAMLAWTALGEDLADLPADPEAWLADQQDETGRIRGPSDGFGINTFATSQSVTALLRNWLPLAGDGDRLCLPAHPYTDVAGTAWYDDGARWVAHFDVATGFPDGTLRPRAGVNRGQASMWLNNTFDQAGGPDHSFSDVPEGIWYEDGANFVGAAPNGEIATGFPDGTFRPKQTLNRAQGVMWLYNAAGSPDVSALPDHEMSDVPAGIWYGDGLAWARSHGIVTGFPDGTFRPKADVNRGQFSQWLYLLAATPEAWDPGAAVVPSTIVFTP